MIARPEAQRELTTRLDDAPVVLLVGPRQCGKTTLARRLLAPDDPNYFDLEDPRDLTRLDEPMTALEGLRGLVVIDEVQRRPDLFPVLRVLADRPGVPTRFLVLGSASPDALRQSAESLAGRVSTMELGGLQVGDLGADQLDRLWLRGGFPRATLAHDDAQAARWLTEYSRTLIERDLPAFDLRLPSSTTGRFLAMVAHRTGQIWSSADPARALGITEHTVRRYLDIATDALLVRQLLPWHSNVSKRQVRSPKVSVRDSGLAHHLLGIASMSDLLRHPNSGSTWEGLIIEEVIRVLRPSTPPYFWATHGGAELDLFLPGTTALGIEVKRSDAPRLTPSMRSALTDLELDRLVVIYPGTRTYPLADRVTVIPAATLANPAAARDALLGG